MPKDWLAVRPDLEAAIQGDGFGFMARDEEEDMS